MARGRSWGEILESYVTKTRDKAAAFAFMKKALKRHGSPATIVTDGLKSYGAAMKISATARSRRSVAMPTIGWKTATCRSDDENEPCKGLGV